MDKDIERKAFVLMANMFWSDVSKQYLCSIRCDRCIQYYFEVYSIANKKVCANEMLLCIRCDPDALERRNVRLTNAGLLATM